MRSLFAVLTIGALVGCDTTAADPDAGSPSGDAALADGGVAVTDGGAATPDAQTPTLDAGDSSDGGVTVPEPDAAMPRGCIDDGRLPPSGWQQELNPLPRSGSPMVTTWEQMFGQLFPSGGADDMRVRPDRYLALSFNTGSTEPSGRIAFSDLSGSVVGVLIRPALVTMSECPGDFGPQADPDCRQVRVGASMPAFRWTRASAPFACDLPPNEDYYFNVAYVSSETEDELDPNQLEWQCEVDEPTAACGHRLQTFTD